MKKNKEKNLKISHITKNAELKKLKQKIKKKLENLKNMTLIKLNLWRQEDTRPVFLKKTKEFWENNKKIKKI